ncbi:MAG: glucose-1-phosphate cytidylyltransferase [Oscillospiraceae bacterium]|nr:glucose-1-phosphate cytidylyltransferase [Oscillospiraceae bacterium]
MKTVILAGGFGTRISEESGLRPKPMIEIGGAPILWHIMKYYSHHGFNEFVICCGYKGYMIKKFFADYYLHRSDLTFDFTCENSIIIHNNESEPWKVTLVDTGPETQTGGRIARIRPYTGGEAFMLTYGDGVSDVDIKALLIRHRELGVAATLTAVRPGGRFGVLDTGDGDFVTGFREKAKTDSGWINAGFMVMEPEVFDYLDGDGCVLERSPMERLAKEGKLGVYRHEGFWQCMDTLRDKQLLEELLKKGEAPWRVW